MKKIFILSVLSILIVTVTNYTIVKPIQISKKQKRMANHEYKTINKLPKEEYILQDANNVLRVIESLNNKIYIKKALTKKAHHFSTDLIETSRLFADIKKEILEDDTKKEHAIKFYNECSRNKKALISIRSLCLSNLVYFNAISSDDAEWSTYSEKMRAMTLAVAHID